MQLNHLTITRFLAAICIVVFHYGLKVFPFNQPLINFVFARANVCVSFFYVLSGFIMVIAYSSRDKIDFWDYMKNRVARIYPIYLISLISVVLLVSNLNLLDLLLSLFAIQSWIPGHVLVLNKPGWSISVEFFFYLLFPLIFSPHIRKIELKKIGVFVIIFWLLSQLATHFLFSNIYEGYPSRSHDLIFYFPVFHLNEFLVGCFTGLLFLKNDREDKNPWAIISFLLVGLFIFLKFNFGLIYHNGFLAFIFAPLLYFMAIDKSKFASFLGLPIFVLLGEISYSIYILQGPVFKFVNILLIKFGLMGIGSITKFYLTLSVLIGVSFLSYYIIEVPMRKIIRKINFNSLLITRIFKKNESY